MDGKTTPTESPFETVINLMIAFDKDQLDHLLLAQLEQLMTTAATAADNAKSQATHSESKAENKYDTLGLELSYLAHGQATRAQQLLADVTWLKQRIKNHTHKTAYKSNVACGSLVSLCDDKSPQELRHFYLLPVAGGHSIQKDNQKVTIITPLTPLGKRLVGRFIDDEINLCINSNISTVTHLFVISQIL